MFFALGLGVVVSFTNPQFDAMPDTFCVAGTIPCVDLKEIRIKGTREGTTDHILLFVLPAQGREGVHETVDVTIPGDQNALWSFEIYPVDEEGNIGCSRWLTVNGRLEAPSLAGWIPIVWYDLHGRKYQKKPTMPGLYFEVQGKKHKKIVVLQ